MDALTNTTIQGVIHMKKLLLIATILVFAALVIALVIDVFAHPGKTDGSGGHYDHDTGVYHYHHGYPAHAHYDMDNDGDIDCPYDFDDQTGSNSGNGSSIIGRPSDIVPEITQPSVTQNEEYEVEIWIVCLLVIIFAIIVVSMYMAIRRKKEEIADINRAHREFIQQEEIRLKKELSNFDCDIAQTYGAPYLYHICNTPPGDYLDKDDLPKTRIADGYKWGEKYTFYFYGVYASHGQRYHRPTCRFAKFGFPANAYTIKRAANKYAPCSICRPVLPELDWVSKYLIHKEFLERHGVSVPQFDFTEEQSKQ